MEAALLAQTKKYIALKQARNLISEPVFVFGRIGAARL